ncbi:esterase/lipase family protein [Pseudohalioglobus sediminis]|nr:alpha/beta hydrolase [Pseudohalioglobus sediminis]
MERIIKFDAPPSAPDPTRPRPRQLLGEARGYRDVVRLVFSGSELRRQPDISGTAAILIPGWKAPEASMGPLRFFLRRRGCDARHWGLGVNRGDPERDSERLVASVHNLSQELGKPLALIGWSLGGVIAREVARECPEAVSQVITYGTPVIGGPTFTPAASSYGKDECRRISAKITELDAASPISVPLTVIFSRRDGVVSWPACIDRSSLQVVHYEVESTHLSMGLDPSVWTLVAQQLARVNI